MDNFLEEYLIAIGAKTDSQSFSEAKKQTSDLEKSLKRIEQNTAFTALLKGVEAFIAAGKFAIDVIKKIGNTLYDNIVGVAKADMAYTKLARSMWVTKETAKSLQMAMDEMGASMQDIAWIPELRDQFFRLREEINKFSTPADADNQLKFIRSIGYDIQVLMIRLKMLREWVVYYLIKYLKPFMDEFKAFINWVSDQIGGRMSTVAKKFAQILGSIIGSIYSAFKIASKVIQSVANWIAELPDNVKKWAVVFSAVGAAIMSGPFGILLAAIGGAFLLLQDFVYYMNGWSSSRSLAPMWEMLLKFTRGTGSDIMTKIKEFLSDVADILDYIVNDLNIREVFDGIKDAVWEIYKGFDELWKTNIKNFKEFFKLIGVGKPQVQSFVGTLAKGIIMAVKNMAEFIKLLGKVLQAAALIKQGEFSKAAGLFKDSVVEFGTNVWNNTKQFWGGVAQSAGEFYGGLSKSVSKALGYDGNTNDMAREAWNEAQRIGKDLGVDPSLIYGQWYHETKGFTSDLATQDYNFGGLTTTTNRGAAYKQPDGSLWYMSFGSIHDYAEYFKRVWGNDIRGARSVEEYAANLKREGYYGDTYENYTSGMYNGMQHIPASAATLDYKEPTLLGGTYAASVPAANGIMPGEWEMAMGGIPGLGNTPLLGGVNIEAINIGGTNASPQQIAEAVRNGVQGAIDARYQRGLSI